VDVEEPGGASVVVNLIPLPVTDTQELGFMHTCLHP
jgi:hypothetical protein